MAHGRLRARDIAGPPSKSPGVDAGPPRQALPQIITPGVMIVSTQSGKASVVTAAPSVPTGLLTDARTFPIPPASTTLPSTTSASTQFLSPSSSTTPAPPASHKSSTAKLAAVIVVPLVLLAILSPIIIVWYISWRRKRRSAKRRSERLSGQKPLIEHYHGTPGASRHRNERASSNPAPRRPKKPNRIVSIPTPTFSSFNFDLSRPASVGPIRSSNERRVRRPIPKNRHSATFSWGAPPPYTSPTRTTFSPLPAPRLDTPDFTGSPLLETAQMAGWVGKGKSATDRAQEHVSRPLATLKDPGAFGPPPKNVNYHGGAAVPNAITPDRRGLGAPLGTREIQEKEEAERRKARDAEEAARKPPPPSLPYRVDTSGLSTSNLPKPPVRRIDHEEQSPPSPARSNTKPKPSLPPRLPPPQSSMPLQSSPSPPPPYSAAPDASPVQNGHINQGAASRLASAGISVPGFGIGSSPRNTTETDGATNSSPDRQGAEGSSAPLSELQSKFSKFSTRSQSPAAPSQATSLAEKQAALSTAQSFQNDPSSVSLSDARNTAATVNNFRERHGDQVTAGWKSANALNKKYDVADRVNSYASQQGSSAQTETQQPHLSPVASPPTSLPLHKRAPPPPPQKPSHSRGTTTSPPPVPLSSKPRS
ncbi:MAG: hypothetical protein Q9181_005544 [Wetmoreana brouardii]